MDNISIYFFWPGLVISIIFSVLLTIGLNLWARRKSADRESHDFEEDGRNAFNDENYRETEHDFEETGDPRSGMSGMIMIGPIPIVFGSGKFRFDQKAFKYALLFFIIVILIWWILARTVFL
ncbi:MAG: DUF131 domain-containing protein [Methanimicrococcus sp.]|nr:DUF131 domain-containing protein [Methanimicrococcus sp.]